MRKTHAYIIFPKENRVIQVVVRMKISYGPQTFLIPFWCEYRVRMIDHSEIDFMITLPQMQAENKSINVSFRIQIF